ncbi:thioredoxin family protein [Citricoccus nitrophenolicus]|uniref:thioredoxin family protein n=1 Tax=Citricoccus nitrophenolicus TaxID=863575 RepID=UPI0031E9A3E0
MATTEITEAGFEQTLTENDIVLVDFWAGWCGPCKQFAPVYEEVSGEHPDVVFGKVDTEAESGLASAANITSIPTLMAFRDQVLVYAQPGAINSAQLQELVTAVKSLDMDEVREKLASSQNPDQN